MFRVASSGIRAECFKNLKKILSTEVFTVLGEVSFIAWHLRRLSSGECRRGLRHFGECLTCLGHDPAPGPIIKRLCATLARKVGWSTNSIFRDAAGTLRTDQRFVERKMKAELRRKEKPRQRTHLIDRE